MSEPQLAWPDPIAYMDTAAATAAGQDYKRRSVAALDIRPGQVVADIGCGPGTDLGRLADAVGPAGSVIGIDSAASTGRGWTASCSTSRTRPGR